MENVEIVFSSVKDWRLCYREHDRAEYFLDDRFFFIFFQEKDQGGY